jgi:hypothetical protein
MQDIVFIMESRIDPTVRYPVNKGIASHDYDIEADSWNYGGLEVFRGTQDPEYTHADVYWLYSETSERIGVAEHSCGDHATFHVMWFYECPFATLLQEEGWTSTEETIWTRMPSHVYDYCIENRITDVELLRIFFLRGNWRLVTPRMEKQDYPDPFKVLFVDDDCIVYTPPEASSVWSMLQLASGGSQEPQRQPVEALV